MPDPQILDQHSFINLGDAAMIALSISLLTMLMSIMVMAKQAREKQLNKLTLLPFFTSISFIVMLLLQITLLNASSQEKK